METARLALLVLALPAAAFVVLAIVAPLRRRGRLAALLSIAAIGAAFLTAVVVWRRIAQAGDLAVATWPWIPADGGPMATVGVLVDELSAAMLLLVTGISLLVQVYSLSYLSDEPAPGLGRYYAYHSLFAFSMLGLVLAPTFVQMFIFWELVGLCSYLLIGYWYDRPSAARAAVKAFWITRLGDVGFIIGIVMLWRSSGTFDFQTLFRMAAEGKLAVAALPTIMTLIWLGAVGKSAQFPLHVWLPDAMEGPTPVSALIHAATMVTAGVFLVVRAMPLFALTPGVLALVGGVGAFTALLAATMACVEDDIKRVLAYSTVSQLGYMMAGAGASAADAGFFHLLTHGVFKALLFLGAGAVIHAVGTNDIFAMGGLVRAMPQTTAVFLIGTLSLAGIPFFGGFFSKEEILAGVWVGGLAIPFAMLAIAAFLTAFYMFRVVFITFFGTPAHGHGHGEGGHAHDGPLTMGLPLWVLAALSMALGIGFAIRHPKAEFEAPGWITPLAIALAVAGIALAWLTYQRRAIDVDRLSRPFALVRDAAEHRFYLDDAFLWIYRLAFLAFSRGVGWVDRYVVDGVLNVLSAWTLDAGDRLRRIRSGEPQDYVYGVALGVLLLLVWFHWLG